MQVLHRPSEPAALIGSYQALTFELLENAWQCKIENQPSFQMQTTMPVPFEVVSSELSPGETVQWSGQPNTRVLFHGEDWVLIPFSLLWGGFAIFWLLAASGIGDFWAKHPDKNFLWFGLVCGTPFVLIGQYMIWGRFVYSYWKKHRTCYALTTKRALIVVNDIRGRTASSAYFENTTAIKKSVRRDGIGRISFGGPLAGTRNWGRHNPPPPTFDDIDSADSVYQIAARIQEQIQKPAIKRVR
jgi:hypothetical protein